MIKRSLMTLLLVLSFSIFYVSANLFGLDNNEFTKSPKIKVVPESWNFGRINDTQVKTYIFQVKNIGNDELIIERLSTSCGCTNAEISTKRIKPRESSELKVTFDPKQTGSSGKVRRDVYLESNDPKQPTKIISIFADLGKRIKTKTSVGPYKPNITISNIIPPKLTSSKLYSRIQSGEKIVILDVREENEYMDKHIPDAIWFPKSKFDKGDSELLRKLEDMDRKTPIVTYCGAGHRSNYVARKLIERGYNAFNLDGISFWIKEGYPVIEGPKLPASQEPSIIHLQEAYENYYLLFKDVVWVDVRNKEDYKQGHIKGALGIPLSEIGSKLADLPKDKEIVLYCEGTWDGGNCGASKSAGRILIKNGFSQGKIKVFEDGYGAWENAGFPVETDVQKENIYSQFICSCCGKILDDCMCGMAAERKGYLDGLIEMGISRETILKKAAEKFGLDSLVDEDIRTQIKDELAKNVPLQRAEIVVEPESFDFGKLSVGKGKVKATFTLRNKGRSNLIIDNIHTSCGCTIASLKTGDGEQSLDFGVDGKSNPDWQTSIPPGQSAKLTVTFDPNYHPVKRFPEQVTRTITIDSNDPVESKKTIKIKAEIVG